MAVRSHLEGLWSAELIGNHAITGFGVLMFEPVRISQGGYEEGRVLGGDRHYAHVGTYRVENGWVAGRLRTVRYDVHEDGAPLFERGEVGVEFHGTLDPGGHRGVLELELAATEPALSGVTRVRLTLRVAT